MSIKTNFNVQVEINPAANQKPNNGAVPTWQDTKFVLSNGSFGKYYEFELDQNVNFGYNYDIDGDILNISIDNENEELPNPGTYLVNAHITVFFGMPFDLTTGDHTAWVDANYGAKIALRKLSSGGTTLATIAQSNCGTISSALATYSSDPQLFHNYSLTTIASFDNNQSLMIAGAKDPDLTGGPTRIQYLATVISGISTKITMLGLG